MVFFYKRWGWKKRGPGCKPKQNNWKKIHKRNKSYKKKLEPGIYNIVLVTSECLEVHGITYSLIFKSQLAIKRITSLALIKENVFKKH